MDTKDLNTIEKALWDMANRLRGNMDASEYKNYILPFMFYRYLSEKQNNHLVEDNIFDVEEGQDPAYVAMSELFGTDDLETIETYAKKTKNFTEFYDVKKTSTGEDFLDEEGAPIYEEKYEWVDEYQEFLKDCSASLGYCIAPLYDWTVLRNLIAQKGLKPEYFSNMFESFNKSLKWNKEAEKKIKDIFNDVNIGSAKLGNTTNERAKALSQIVELVSEVSYVDDTGRDVLGAIYEYLIKQFAATAGKKGGEFYTPHEVSMVMSKIVTHDFKNTDTRFTVFDPTCGSGSLLLTVGKTLPGGEEPGAIHYYGQELNTSTCNLAKINMMMNNVSYDCFSIRNADTLGSDWPDGEDENGKYHLRTFDAVVANPPYSQNWEAPESYLKDPRFREFGGKLAPKSKADYAFLLDGLYHLNLSGTMAIVLPHGVLFRGAAEKTIREKLIQKNLIDTIIGLPANLFYGTSIPTVILVLKKNKDNRDILFIDASNYFIKSKTKNILSPEDIDRIFDAYKERKDIEKFAHVASEKEIKDNDYNLNIPRYVDTSEEEPEIDLKKIDEELKAVNKEIQDLQAVINEQLRLLGVLD